MNCPQSVSLYNKYMGGVKAFRTELAKGLIGEYSSRKRSGRPTLNLAKRFCAAHFPMRGSERVHRCHFRHTYNHQRHETVWYCQDCDWFLCHNGREDDCFLLYHTHHVTSTTDRSFLSCLCLQHYSLLPIHLTAKLQLCSVLHTGVINTRSHRSTRGQIDYTWPFSA